MTQSMSIVEVLFGCSTASFFTEAGPESPPGDEHDLLAEIGQALSKAGPEALPRDQLRRTLRIASVLTDLEARLGLDGGSLGPHSYDISPPKTAWEATQQGILAAAEERRRLNLGVEIRIMLRRRGVVASLHGQQGQTDLVVKGTVRNNKLS